MDFALLIFERYRLRASAPGQDLQHRRGNSEGESHNGRGRLVFSTLLSFRIRKEMRLRLELKNW